MGKHPPKAAFDDLAAAFADYGTTVRGYVRYQITQRNLAAYLANGSLNILDIGGGSGADTAWLAEKGHNVTYVEPSIEQRRFAERRFNFLIETDIRRRITIAGATLADLNPGNDQFDLVLIHAVAMYQSQPHRFLEAGLRYVKAGGMVSIIEKNYYGAEDRAVRRQDYTGLNRLRRSQRAVNNLKQNVHAFTPEELEELLQANDFEVLEWSGIRTITDDFDMPSKNFTPKQLAQIVDTEYRHGHHPSIRGQGQLIHFIARRNPD